MKIVFLDGIVGIVRFGRVLGGGLRVFFLVWSWGCWVLYEGE